MVKTLQDFVRVYCEVTMNVFGDTQAPPHSAYLVYREEFGLFVARPCYGMHHPWWVPAVDNVGFAGGRQVASPIGILDDDRWSPWQAPLNPSDLVQRGQVDVDALAYEIESVFKLLAAAVERGHIAPLVEVLRTACTGAWAKNVRRLGRERDVAVKALSAALQMDASEIAEEVDDGGRAD